MLANGQGKSRAAETDRVDRRPPGGCLFLSTGEQALADKVAEGGRRIKAGQEVRLVDLPADAGRGLGLFEGATRFASAQALADHLRQVADRFYGTAARAYLQRITVDLEGLGSKVNQVAQNFVAKHCPAGSDGQVRRVCNPVWAAYSRR